ncbi:helix-turn-helix transcriptional regulator [Nocardiopsis sp. CNT312]|uniref:helix-turn-helix domain-containing protein n=1 Tax=Nocardiopsis sp. CNT312 TaxID=1137268 RepID=UPI0012DD9ADC|nr:helix-turn-helix transcriptional regulator [Nocardiopsis sp. CNT312]
MVEVVTALRSFAPELSQVALARLTGLSATTIHRLESRRRPLRDPVKIRQALERLGLAATARAEGGAAVENVAMPAPNQGWEADQVVDALARLGGERISRRRLLAAATSGLAAQVVQWAVADPFAALQASQGRPIAPHLVDALVQGVDALRLADARGGASAHLHALARPQLAFVQQLLSQGHMDTAVRGPLLAVASDLAGLMGWMMVDAGDHAGAARLFPVALRAAHTAHDPVMGAGVVSYMTVLSYSTGHGSEAALMARTAQMRTAGQASAHVETMLSIRQARGYAVARQRMGAMRALEGAFTAFERGPGERDPAWLYWMSGGELHAQAGSCLLELGDYEAALGHLDEAQEAFGGDCVRDRACAQVRAATALVRLGQVEAALERGHRAVDLAAPVRSRRLAEQVADLGEELAALPVAGAGEVAERARVLSSAL